MNARRDFDGTISDWLDEQAGRGAPDYLAEVLSRTSRTRQRPAWSSLERWLPVEIAFTGRVRPIPRFAWAIALAAILALAAAALLVAGGGPRRVPHFGAALNGSFVFVDGTDLKAAAPDGSNVHVIATLPAGVESLTFAPDGMHLAYRTTGTPASLVVARADGSNPVVVSAGLSVAESAQVATGGSFAWSPDSHRLTFAWSVLPDIQTIAVVDADGSHLTQLFPGRAGEVNRFDPDWSADGSWISFFSPRGPGDTTISLIRADGSGERRLTTTAVDEDYIELTWSADPSQSRFEFVATGHEVRIFDVSTGTETSVGTGFWASWSPDGQRIAWWDAVAGAPGSATSGGIRVAYVADVMAGPHDQVGRHDRLDLFPDLNNGSCFSGLAVVGICSPASWSPDSKWVFGPDPTGRSIVFATLDAPRTVRTIALDHRVDLANGPQGYLAWQAVAP